VANDYGFLVTSNGAGLTISSGSGGDTIQISSANGNASLTISSAGAGSVVAVAGGNTFELSGDKGFKTKQPIQEPESKETKEQMKAYQAKIAQDIGKVLSGWSGYEV
jgi:hypothetical protein